ncbi:DUF6907 domain-containing protein [Streptomyces populi]
MSARTVTLTTLDRGLVTVPEPGWCRGHEGDLPQRYTDTTHRSVTVRAGGVLEAFLSQAPYLEQRPEPHPVVSVQLAFNGDIRVDDMGELLEALRSAERVLQFAAAEALRLRGAP